MFKFVFGGCFFLRIFNCGCFLKVPLTKERKATDGNVKI